jgi:hypothetical protein
LGIGILGVGILGVGILGVGILGWPQKMLENNGDLEFVIDKWWIGGGDGRGNFFQVFRETSQGNKIKSLHHK